MNLFDCVSRIDADTFAVTTTPKVLASACVTSRQKRGRIGIRVTNTGSATVYIGGARVTSENGIPIKAGEAFTLPTSVEGESNIYIVATAATSVNFAEFFQ